MRYTHNPTYADHTAVPAVMKHSSSNEQTSFQMLRLLSVLGYSGNRYKCLSGHNLIPL
jgi:hypothetical protein